MTLRHTCTFVRRKARAISIRPPSSARVPSRIVTTIVGSTVMTSATISARSFRPAIRYATTNKRMRGTVNVTINDPWSRSSARFERPMSAPSATPAVSAIAKAISTRRVVTHTWKARRPFSTSRPTKPSTSSGPGRTSPIERAPTIHSSTSEP